MELIEERERAIRQLEVCEKKNMYALFIFSFIVVGRGGKVVFYRVHAEGVCTPKKVSPLGARKYNFPCFQRKIFVVQNIKTGVS